MRGLHKPPELKILRRTARISVSNTAFSGLISTKTNVTQLCLNINHLGFYRRKSTQEQHRKYIYILNIALKRYRRLHLTPSNKLNLQHMPHPVHSQGRKTSKQKLLFNKLFTLQLSLYPRCILLWIIITFFALIKKPRNLKYTSISDSLKNAFILYVLYQCKAMRTFK